MLKKSLAIACIITSFPAHAGDLLEEVKKYIIHDIKMDKDLEIDKELKPSDIELEYREGNQIAPGGYILIDLNNDGIKEMVLIPYNSEICGAARCRKFYVLKSTENGIKSLLSKDISSMGGVGAATINKKMIKGYKEIELYINLTATGVNLYKLHWDGKYYTEAEHGTLEYVKKGKPIYKSDKNASNSSDKQGNDISGSSAFKINRFYQSSDDFYHIVISTDRKTRVKCVIYDYSGEPITADTFLITPPTEDVPIMTKGVSSLVKNVKCFKIE